MQNRGTKLNPKNIKNCLVINRKLFFVLKNYFRIIFTLFKVRFIKT